MKSNGFLVLALVVLSAVLLGVVSYFGVGSGHNLGAKDIRQGLDLKGGVSILYEAGIENPSADDINAAIALIQGRLDNKNYTEAQVGRQGATQIRVDIPGVDDAETAVREIGQMAMLYFVDEAGTVLLTGTDVTKATAQISNSSGGAGSYVVALSFSAEGTSRFAQATQDNIGKTIAIYLDQELISQPTVNSAITDGNAIIQGDFTAQSAQELAKLISEGSLPFELVTLSVNNVGATLGANALNTSLIAGLIGSLLVLVFMVLIYKTLGAAADLALIIYIGITMILISLFKVTLTLPGIAGIILSIGMAVDANVIIFERMREEISAGKSLKTAIDAGFKRAFPAILDSNVTTLIAAAVLFFLGSGPVKGFAQTLAIGILVSMFTALTVTRNIIKALVEAGAANPKLYIKVKAAKGAAEQ